MVGRSDNSLNPFPNTFPKSYEREFTTRISTVTAYNPGDISQTDDSPCIGSANVDICEKAGVAACPRNIPLYTFISIDGITYQCLDRLHYRKVNQFDISFLDDTQGALDFGRQIKEVKIYK